MLTHANRLPLVLLIKRSFRDQGNTTCLFVDKVMHAQRMGASAAIIYDHKESNELMEMDGEDGHVYNITIPSVFVTLESGLAVRAPSLVPSRPAELPLSLADS